MRAILLLLSILLSVVAQAATYPIHCSGVDHGTLGAPNWSGGTVDWPDGTDQAKVDRSLAGYLCEPCAAAQQAESLRVEALREQAQAAADEGRYAYALTLLSEARQHRMHVWGDSGTTDARLLEIADYVRRERIREERVSAPIRRVAYLAGALVLLCALIWIRQRRMTR